LNINGIYGDFHEFIENFFGEKLNLNEKEQKRIEFLLAHFNIPLFNPEIVCRKSQYREMNTFENFFRSQHLNEPIKEEKQIDIDFLDVIGLYCVSNMVWSGVCQ
jgi:hypothetical protein